MSYAYKNVDELLDAVIGNKVSATTLDGDLLQDLLQRVVEIVTDHDLPETDENVAKYQLALEKIGAVIDDRLSAQDAGNFDGIIVDSIARGNSYVINTNFTLQ